MIVEVIIGGAATFLFGRGIYHSGTLSGWIFEGLTSSIPPPPPKANPTLADAYERYCIQADHEERQKLLSSPTGWLLDPFRYPTNPHVGRHPRAAAAIDEVLDTLARMGRVRSGLETIPVVYGSLEAEARKGTDLEPMYVGPAMLNPVHTYRMVMADPPCPACGSENTEASLTHGNETSMWWCRECTAEFTTKGETRKSKKARKLLRLREEQEARDAEALAAKKLQVLPCGCTGAIEQDHILNYGRESTCQTCFSTWEPRSNDKTGRSLGQGEKVRWSAKKRRAGFGEQDVPFDLPLPPANRD